MLSSRARDPMLALALVILALALRLPGLDVFLTPDETRWTCRSANFWNALAERRFEDTYQKEHPGVVTMWLGGLGQPVDPGSGWARACREIPSSQLVEDAPREDLDDIRNRLFAGRIRVAAFVSLGVGAAYLLSVGLLGWPAALLGGLLLAAEPFQVALGRVLHLDAVTATLMTLSLLALLRAARREPRADSSHAGMAADGPPDGGVAPAAGRSGSRSPVWRRGARSGVWLAVSGALAGAAALSKSPGLFMGPMAALVLAADALAERLGGSRRLTGPALTTCAVDAAGRLAAWSVAAAVVYVVMWPAMWVAPMQSVAGVLGGAVGYAAEGHEGFNYFMGRPTLDPGPLFYPVAWLARTTPFGVLGVGLALAVWAVGWRARVAPRSAGDRWAVAGLLIHAVLFAAFMTAGAKKFDRYLMPALPALSLVAGWGFSVAVEGLRRAWRPGRLREGTHEPLAWLLRAAALPLAAALLLAGLAASGLPHRPYFFTYYSPLTGGASTAPRLLLVGWGEGLDVAARWLNARPDARQLQVATRYRSAVGPLVRGSVLEMNKIDPATVDYHLFYLNQLQRNLDPELMAEYFPGAFEGGAADGFDFGRAWSSGEVSTAGQAAAMRVELGGIEYAWLFPNDSWRPVAAWIDQRSEPANDAILARAGSRFARLYDGPLEVIALEPDASPEEVQALLADAFARWSGLWHVRYDDLIPRPGLGHADYELAVRTFRTSAAEFGNVRTARFGVYAEDAAEIEFGRAPSLSPVGREVRFGTELVLKRTGMTADALRWGQGLGIALEWEALRDLDASYTAFLHLIGPDGRRWAHEDRLIGDRDMVPTERWVPGEPRVNMRTLQIGPGTPPGEYKLLVGVYDSATGQRLPLWVDGERRDGDAHAIAVEVRRPPVAPTIDDVQLAWPAEAASGGGELGHGVSLLGLDADRPLVGGGEAELKALWRVVGPDDAPGAPARRVRAERVSLTLRDERDRRVAHGVFDLVPGLAPETLRTGDVLGAWYPIELDGRAVAGTGSARLELLDDDGRAAEAAGAARGAEGAEGAVEVPVEISGPLRVFELPEQVASGSDGPSHLFGELAALRAVEVQADTAVVGGSFTPRFWWQALAEDDRTFARFVHVLDGSGNIRAQLDGPPLGVEGEHPTSAWLAGEFVPDAPAVEIGADVEPGVYRIAVGLYDPDTGERAPVYDASGSRVSDDRPIVGEVRVRSR